MDSDSDRGILALGEDIVCRQESKAVGTDIIHGGRIFRIRIFELDGAGIVQIHTGGETGAYLIIDKNEQVYYLRRCFTIIYLCSPILIARLSVKVKKPTSTDNLTVKKCLCFIVAIVKILYAIKW